MGASNNSNAPFVIIRNTTRRTLRSASPTCITGDTASAEPALRKAVELSREQYLDALCWLATLLNDSRRFTEAEPLARKALEQDSSSWQANAELARSLLGLNNPAEAKQRALAASKLQPDNSSLYLVLANVHSQLGDAPGLLEDLSKYLRLAPTGPMADKARAEQKTNTGRTERRATSSAPTACEPRSGGGDKR
jgi:tetratricopeptide (TPR) repeat protein